MKPTKKWPVRSREFFSTIFQGNGSAWAKNKSLERRLEFGLSQLGGLQQCAGAADEEIDQIIKDIDNVIIDIAVALGRSELLAVAKDEKLGARQISTIPRESSICTANKPGSRRKQSIDFEPIISLSGRTVLQSIQPWRGNMPDPKKPPEGKSFKKWIFWLWYSFIILHICFQIVTILFCVLVINPSWIPVGSYWIFIISNVLWLCFAIGITIA